MCVFYFQAKVFKKSSVVVFFKIPVNNWGKTTPLLNISPPVHKSSNYFS